MAGFRVGSRSCFTSALLSQNNNSQSVLRELCQLFQVTHKEHAVLSIYVNVEVILLIYSYSYLKVFFDHVCVFAPDQNAGTRQFAARKHDVQLHQHLPDRGHQGAVESER